MGFSDDLSRYETRAEVLFQVYGGTVLIPAALFYFGNDSLRNAISGLPGGSLIQQSLLIGGYALVGRIAPDFIRDLMR